MPHYQLISITNTLTVEYESCHEDLPAYNIPHRTVSINNQPFLITVSAVNNLPGDISHLQTNNWYLKGKDDGTPILFETCYMNPTKNTLKELSIYTGTKENTDDKGKYKATYSHEIVSEVADLNKKYVVF